MLCHYIREFQTEAFWLHVSLQFTRCRLMDHTVCERSMHVVVNKLHSHSITAVHVHVQMSFAHTYWTLRTRKLSKATKESGQAWHSLYTYKWSKEQSPCHIKAGWSLGMRLCSALGWFYYTNVQMDMRFVTWVQPETNPKGSPIWCESSNVVASF